MVLQKRLGYGFNGYEVPATPRASRSVRRRRLFKKHYDDSKMYAFELLANVAGELLRGKEMSPAPTHASAGRSEFSIKKDGVKKEQAGEEHSFKQEPCDQGSCDEGLPVFMPGTQTHSHDSASKEFFHGKDASPFGPACAVTKSEIMENTSSDEKAVIDKCRNEFPCVIGATHAGRSSPSSMEPHDKKVKDGSKRLLKVEQPKPGSVLNGTVVDNLCMDDVMDMDAKPPAIVSSDSSVEVPLYGTHKPCSSFTRDIGDAKVNSRDDDENSSGCTQPSPPNMKSYRPHFGDRRNRKMLATKYRKAGPPLLNDDELYNTELDAKPVFHNRKMRYTRQRTQRCSFKRRKLFEQSSTSISDGGMGSDVVSCTPERSTTGEVIGLHGTVHQASRASSPIVGPKTSLEPKDSHARIRIKSFRVPEIFIELPQTATVGCLKKAVMESLSTLLGGGLRVGVLLHGKKVRDDNRTIVQAGISHDDKLANLGFTLEPTSLDPPTPQGFVDTNHLLPCESPQPLSRYPPDTASDPGTAKASPDIPVNNISNSIESDQKSIPSTANLLPEKTTPDSMALVAVPAMKVEALTVVPLHGKSKRSELVQRRIRRPFSVSEVEALVQAVEKLGTGRWRDVKLRAFENAKHRTYVDLKDKWKTLVHTARISPQQRRGEPVPQELLDRVLSAHAYWSQQNSKSSSRTTNSCSNQIIASPPN